MHSPWENRAAEKLLPLSADTWECVGSRPRGFSLLPGALLLGFNDNTRQELEFALALAVGLLGVDLTGGSFSPVTSALLEASSVLPGSLLAREVIPVISVGTCSYVCVISAWSRTVGC